jgi:hypothetical protein
MKTLLSTLAAATFVLAMNSCTKSDMPVPDVQPQQENQVKTGHYARVTDSTGPFIFRPATPPVVDTPTITDTPLLY